VRSSDDPLAINQLRFVRIGASNHPQLTLFPDNGGPPLSYFWANPGVRLMVPGIPSFTALMPALCANELAETYYPTSRYRQAQYLFATHSYLP
jgi:hypothetical protein